MAANGIDHYVGSFADDAAVDAFMAAIPWTRQRGNLYYNSTDGNLMFWDGAAWIAWTAGGGGGGAFPGIELEQVIFVDEGSNVAEDGSAASPYQTIAAAYTQAKTLAPTVTNPVTVFIWGGVYDESLVLDTDYINLIGIARDSVLIRQTVNAAATITLVEVICEISRLTVESTVSGEAAIDIPTGEVSGPTVLQLTDCFIRSVGNVAAASSMFVDNVASIWAVDCEFVGTAAWGYALTVDYAAKIEFSGCRYYTEAATAGIILFTNGGDITFDNCQSFDPTWSYYGRVEITGGTGDYYFTGCHLEIGATISDRCIIADAEISLTVVGCYFRTGATSAIEVRDTDVVLQVVGCNFYKSTNTGYNIAASPAAGLATPAIIRGNNMNRGMQSKITTKDKVKHVNQGEAGTGWGDCYLSLLEACGSVKEADCIVMVESDQTVGNTPAPSYRCLIDGQGQYALARAAGNAVFTVGNSADLTLRGLTMTGSIDVSGTGIVRLTDQCKLTGLIDMLAGTTTASLVSIEDSVIVGDATDEYALRFLDADPKAFIMRSYLKGYTGKEAIKNGLDNENIHIGWSTVMYGGAEGDPMSAPGTPAFSSHHNIYNVDPSGAGYANNIGTPYDSFDPDGDWNWGM